MHYHSFFESETKELCIPKTIRKGESMDEYNLLSGQAWYQKK